MIYRVLAVHHYRSTSFSRYLNIESKCGHNSTPREKGAVCICELRCALCQFIGHVVAAIYVHLLDYSGKPLGDVGCHARHTDNQCINTDLKCYALHYGGIRWCRRYIHLR